MEGDGPKEGDALHCDSTVQDWAVAECKRLTTSRRISDADAVHAACRRAPAMKLAAGVLAALDSSSAGMPAELVKYVAKLANPEALLDEHVVTRCRKWLAANRFELTKSSTPLAMVASVAPIVDASINNKAKAVDPTHTEACYVALKGMNLKSTASCKLPIHYAAAVGAKRSARPTTFHPKRSFRRVA